MNPEIEAFAAKGEFPTPWSRKIQKMVARMTEEELANYPELKIIQEAHTLIFNATYKLAKPGLSLPEVISTCGRRLRGIHLGLQVGHDILPTHPVALCQVLDEAHGVAKDWEVWDPKQPLEVHMADMLLMEWQGMYTMGADPEEAIKITAQIERALKKWQDDVYRNQVMKRLREIGVEDFKEDDFHSRLLYLASDFYLNHPAGAPRVRRGISLLEEIVARDASDYGSAYCLANIKRQLGDAKAALSISEKAMNLSLAQSLRYNSARLGLCQADALMAGAQGTPIENKWKIREIVFVARKRLDASEFWMIASKYQHYSRLLNVHEQWMKIHCKREDGTYPADIPLYSGFTQRELLDAALMFDRISLPDASNMCAGCEESNTKLSLCSGCREAKYCSTKCQREHWPRHKEECKRRQKQRKASGNSA